jgi:hypothetical protein
LWKKKNHSPNNNYNQTVMRKVLMHGAIIHDGRWGSASTYFGTQSEAGSAEVALQRATNGLQVISCAENVTAALE